MNVDHYWVKLGTRAQIALLSILLPGVLLHELTHYWAFRDVSDQIWIDYDTVSCYAVITDGAPKYRRVLGQVAPTLLACLLLPVCYWSLSIGLSGTPMVFLAVNYVLFAAPSPGDIKGAASVMAT